MFDRSIGISQVDPELWNAIQLENRRQEDHIELIASENYTSPAVMAAQGSQLTNKYAEGYPGKRYYGGCEYVDLAEQLAWRVPRLELNDTPLREAVALFNRHSRVRLELATPALGDLRVSGVVRADNTPALLQLLRADYGIEAEPTGDRAFVLSRRR